MMLARLAHTQRIAIAGAARASASRVPFAGSLAPCFATQALFTSSSLQRAAREPQNTLALRLAPASHTPAQRLMLSRPTALGSPLASAHAAARLQHVRCLSSRRNPWQQNSDWMTTAKTGALVMLGAGALIASTSLAFGAIIMGAAGYGVYSLYQKVFGPYRSRYSSGDPFSGVNADIDRLQDLFGRKQSRSSTHARDDPNAMGSRELDALVQGLPLVVRGLVKTIFSFVGSTMKLSMQRAGELRQLVNERVQSHPRITSQFGGGVSVSTPQQWMESTVNGVGRIEAVFPVTGGARGHVTAKAAVGQGGNVSLQELKFRNHATGEVIDLLRDGGGSSGPRKTVVDAEYVEL